VQSSSGLSPGSSQSCAGSHCRASGVSPLTGRSGARVLPVEGCLQDLMYLMQSQGAVDLQLAPNRRLTVD
jgi:hypothetical protein